MNVVLFQLALQVFLLSVVEGVNVVLFQLALQVFLLSVVEGVNVVLFQLANRKTCCLWLKV